MVMQNKTVYLIRHGQSVDNAALVFQAADSPLSLAGKGQAELLAKRMAKTPFDVLISSPQPRAMQTAAAITATTGKATETSNLFVERIKPVLIDGKPYSDEAATAIYKSWDDSLYTPGLHADDGENYDDIIGRADAALDYLLARPEGKIAIVTHGYFLRTMVSRVLLGENMTGDILRKFQMLAQIENTGLTTLKYSDAYAEDFSWRLHTYNDHSHLV